MRVAHSQLTISLYAGDGAVDRIARRRSGRIYFRWPDESTSRTFCARRSWCWWILLVFFLVLHHPLAYRATVQFRHRSATTRAEARLSREAHAPRLHAVAPETRKWTILASLHARVIETTEENEGLVMVLIN